MVKILKKVEKRTFKRCELTLTLMFRWPIICLSSQCWRFDVFNAVNSRNLWSPKLLMVLYLLTCFVHWERGSEPYLCPADVCPCTFPLWLFQKLHLCAVFPLQLLAAVLKLLRSSVFILWFSCVLQQSGCSSAINIESNPKIDGF